MRNRMQQAEVQYWSAYHFSNCYQWEFHFTPYHLPSAALLFSQWLYLFVTTIPIIGNSSCRFVVWQSVKDVTGPLLNVNLTKFKLTIPSASIIEKWFVSKAKLTAQCFLQSPDFDSCTVGREANVVQVSWKSRTEMWAALKRVCKFPSYINFHSVTYFKKPDIPYFSLQWINSIYQNKQKQLTSYC